MINNCILVFDIGKTNQKYFLFNTNYNLIMQGNKKTQKTKDDDGDTCDDIEKMTSWIKKVFYKYLNSNKYKITKVNFSAFGATLVHLDSSFKIIKPVYDYNKKIDEETISLFYSKYGPEKNFSLSTGSKNLNMLNSGKQIFWLKRKKPNLYKRIKYSLHLPQYLSFLFTDELATEYTSIGCHTDLWDYENKKYHYWVKNEGIHKLFPPIVKTNKTITKTINSNKIVFGIGIHDSSSALQYYLANETDPFILISTGTWCINFNPFARDNIFDIGQINNGATAYMKIDSSPVKTSRIFLGAEHEIKLKQLIDFFQIKNFDSSKIKFNKKIYLAIKKNKNNYRWTYLSNENCPKHEIFNFENFDEAYHRLILELFQILKKSISVIFDECIKKIYVDGGFSKNKIFIEILKINYPNHKIIINTISNASSRGAAMLI